MHKKGFFLVAGILGLVLFFGINVLASATLRGVRQDLTEEKLYTLSEGSKAIARGLDEPIRLYLYFSDQAADQVSVIDSYGQRAREVLEGFVRASRGKIVLEVVDPEAYSEEEDRAVGEGIYGVPLPGGAGTLYLGLVGTNATGDKEVIPFLDFQKERFLEYDVSKLLYSLANPDRRVVGLITPLPMEGSPANPMTGAPPQQRWQILAQIESFFDVKTLGTDVDRISDEVDVLLIVHPRDLAQETLYAIDQYVLAGGKTVVLVDAWCEADTSGANPQNPMGTGANRTSDLGPLLGAWGLELVPNKVLADRENAIRVNAGTQMRSEQLDYLVWLGLDAEAFDQEDAVTSLLQTMRVPTSGILRPLPDAKTTFAPLVRSSEDSMQVDVGMLQFPDAELIKRLQQMFVSEHQRQTIAARISGPADTAFPDGPPAPAPIEGEEAEPVPEDPDRLTSASESIQVIVMADADFLLDRFWIQEERLFGQIPLGWRKTADNGDFVINSIENLSGGEELISIRARGRFSRPFEVVDQLREEAEQRYLAEEEELQRRLEAAQQRINELQREKTPDDALILSPEQERELEQAREDMLAAKRKLREVRHNLNKDIESLGTRIKVINIGLLPLLVTVAAVALGAWRIQRRAG